MWPGGTWARHFGGDHRRVGGHPADGVWQPGSRPHACHGRIHCHRHSLQRCCRPHLLHIRLQGPSGKHRLAHLCFKDGQLASSFLQGWQHPKSGAIWLHAGRLQPHLQGLQWSAGCHCYDHQHNLHCKCRHALKPWATQHACKLSCSRVVEISVIK